MKNKKVKIKLSGKDYEASLLPSTRKAQFKDILTHEFKTLLLVGAWLLLFFLPILSIEIFSNIFVYTYITQNNGALTPEEKKAFEMMVTLIKEASLVFGYLVFSFGIAGSLRIIRNLVYGEVIFFKDDFITGIKKYWKLCLGAAFVFGLLQGSTEMLGYFVNSYSNESYLYIFHGFATGVFYLFVVPILFFYVSLSMTYELSFAKCLGLAIRFALSNFLVCIPFSLILFALHFIGYIGILLVVILLDIALVLLLGPFYLLLWHLYVTSRFDRYINEKQFPDVYKKGLRKGE